MFAALKGHPLIQDQCINACRICQCSDPRDHVFGLMGVAEHFGGSCEVVDYRSTVTEVFQRAYKNMLIRDSDKLIKIEAEHTESDIHDLPSWVPDFSHNIISAPLFPFLYAAGGFGTMLQLSDNAFSHNDSLLTLPGFIVDTVQDCSET